MMRPLFTASCLAAGSFLAPHLGAAEGNTVVDVVVEGTQHIHPDRILSRIETTAGDSLNEVLANNDVHTIESMGAFAQTTKVIEQVAPGQVRVIFRVRELPYLADVEIQGVGHFTERRVKKVLRTVQGGHLNPVLVEADRKALVRELRSRNYLNVSVDAKTFVDEDTGLGTVTYVISSGYKVKVARTRYLGLPDGAYKYFADQAILNKPGQAFEPDMLDLYDIGAVEKYLHDQGYLEAKVTATKVEFFDEIPAFERRSRNGPRLAPEGRRDDRVAIIFTCDPGPRYRLGDVRFIGNTVATDEAMRSAFGMPRGSWFERRDIETGKREALGLIRNQGYARAWMVEDPVADQSMLTVDLTYQVREGSPYRIGRIDIDGNIKTKDAVVRRNLRMLPGDLWTDTARDRSRTLIMREGVFVNQPGRPLRVEPLFAGQRDVPGAEDLKEVDLLVELTEAKTGRFSFNIGFASGAGVIGQVQFSEDNFDLWGLMSGDGWRGAGHKLNAAASWSEERTSVSTSWTNPHIMDSPYLVRLRAARSESNALDWEERRISGSVTFGRNFLDNDLRFRVGYTYTDLKIDEVEDDAPDDALDGEGSYWLNSIRLSQEYSLLDNPSYPTEGLRAELSQEASGGLSGLSSRDEFTRFGAEFDAFIPIAESGLGGVTYIHVGQRASILNPINDTDQVPFYERLYGGGSAPRHRGFERFELGPTAINQLGNEARQGGDRDYTGTIEVSVPVTGVNNGLRVVTFFDFGNVWGEDESANFGDLRYAVGAGLRFPAAFPIAFDYAYLIDAESGEPRTQFHFTLSGFVF